jgi:hypothetical protein
MVGPGATPGHVAEQIQDFFGDPPAAGSGKPSGFDGLSEAGDGLVNRAFGIRHVSVSFLKCHLRKKAVDFPASPRLFQIWFSRLAITLA